MTTRRAWDFEAPDASWQEQAACRGQAPHMDTTDLAAAAGLIKRYCHTCPVLTRCRAEAETLASGTGYGTDRAGKPDGVWAGLVWFNGRPREAPLGEWTRPQCGSRAGAEAHRRFGERSCSPCWQADCERTRRAAA